MRLLLVLAATGIALFVQGYQQLKLYNVSSEHPRQITLRELVENGPGDNAHLLVSDFYLCTSAYIYEEKYGRCIRAWIPALPGDDEYALRLDQAIDDDGIIEGEFPLPADIKVIVLVNTESIEEIQQMSTEKTIEGMIINEIESLSPEENRLLSESYPGIDFNRCWILRKGQRPPGKTKLMIFLGGGFVLLLSSALLLTREIISEKKDTEWEETV